LLLSDVIESHEVVVYSCIRPNADNRASQFDVDKVLTQLRYTGVLQTVNIRHVGYSYRPTFDDFMSRYGNLTSSMTSRSQCW